MGNPLLIGQTLCEPSAVVLVKALQTGNSSTHLECSSGNDESLAAFSVMEGSSVHP